MLLEISITGIGPIAATVGIAALIGAIVGALIYRNNSKKAEADLAQANVDLTAVKNQLAKLQTGAQAVVDAVRKV